MKDIDLTPMLRNKMKAYPRKPGRYNSSELFFILSGKTTPEKWLKPDERKMQDFFNMWSGIGIHAQVQELLNGRPYEEKKVEYSYKGIVLVGKADFLPPSREKEVWEFKTSEKTMTRARDYHEHQVKLYCTMFEKEKGIVFQPVKDADGIYLKNLGEVHRSDKWFFGELDKLLLFHEKVLAITNSK